jgi:ABC-type nitrate/sulfonate/bicarbonate transport system substrate-binding protein
MLNNGNQIRQFTLKNGVLAILLFLTLIFESCSYESELEKKESITMGMEATAVNSLIYIAQDMGFFSANNLEVVINDSYSSGAAATVGMLEGKADISTTAELALVRYVLAGQPVLTIGSIDMFMHMKLISRKDLGIESISDFEGKKIGVPIKTAADFKLDRFLNLHGVDTSKITIVDVQAPDAVDALINGVVEAIVTWQPNVMIIQDALGERAVTWQVQSDQLMYGILITTKRWIEKNPDSAKRLMKSLLEAEDYLIQNADHARGIVQKRLGYDDYDERYIETIWPEHQFTVRLDQSLILAMEDQARWMIENNLTEEKNVPDFLDYIHSQGLESVRPAAVNLIRMKEKP